MGRKARKHEQVWGFDSNDELDKVHYVNPGRNDHFRRAFGADWDNYSESQRRSDARREIKRRNDRKNKYLALVSGG